MPGRRRNIAFAYKYKDKTALTLLEGLLPLARRLLVLGRADVGADVRVLFIAIRSRGGLSHFGI